MTTPERPGDWPYGADQAGFGQPPTGPQPYVEPPIAGMPYNAPAAPAPYYPPAPQPYQQPYPYPYAQAPSTNGMAIAAMVLGILWVYWIGSILALIFGYVARDQIKRTGQSGDGMAIAGIVLGWVGIGFLILGITVWSSVWW
jgi:hypothetical protein